MPLPHDLLEFYIKDPVLSNSVEGSKSYFVEIIHYVGRILVMGQLRIYNYTWHSANVGSSVSFQLSNIGQTSNRKPTHKKVYTINLRITRMFYP